MGQETPQKIAVLGGGIASLTAVEQLTSPPGWRDKYDITVYQMGWRLGGKGASGRARDKFDRIEEHGYHMWFGFYDNAFHLIRNIYTENNRSSNVPLAKWEEAFKPVNYWVTADKVGEGRFVNWPLEFLPNPMEPGKDVAPPSSFGLVIRACRWSRTLFKSLHQTSSFSNYDDEFTRAGKGYFHEVLARFRKDVAAFVMGVMGRWLYEILRLINHNERTREHHDQTIESPQNLIERLQARIEKRVSKHLEARRMWILSDFIISNLRGVLVDGVLLRNDFSIINDIDYRDWLKRHGATEFTLQSPLVQGFYALVFSGDKRFFTFEAGTALRATLEVLLNYKGSVYWKMQAGMGDVVFAPIYEVLKKRGVKFRFFHRVTNVKPAADGKNIESITIARQVNLENGLQDAEYDPLVKVRGLPCWPSEPRYEQIVEGPELKARQINLECSWSGWKDREIFTLHAGEHFDKVVLGISINALPHICPEIIAARKEWRRMTSRVKAVPTMGVQLWMYPDIAGLGSPMWRNEICLVSTYVEPCDTWADKSDLLMRESWPDGHTPGSIAYLTGPMMPDFKLEPFAQVCFPSRASEVVKRYTREFLTKHAQYLWPNWIHRDDKQPCWEMLVDPENRCGEQRLEAQYFRANVEPTERYVLTVTGSSRHRLAANESGYDNLVLTGDWTRNTLNVGCIEAAVITGIYAAQAVQGLPLHVDHQPKGPMSFLMARHMGRSKC